MSISVLSQYYLFTETQKKRIKYPFHAHSVKKRRALKTLMPSTSLQSTIGQKLRLLYYSSLPSLLLFFSQLLSRQIKPTYSNNNINSAAMLWSIHPNARPRGSIPCVLPAPVIFHSSCQEPPQSIAYAPCLDHPNFSTNLAFIAAALHKLRMWV